MPKPLAKARGFAHSGDSGKIIPRPLRSGPPRLVTRPPTSSGTRDPSSASKGRPSAGPFPRSEKHRDRDRTDGPPPDRSSAPELRSTRGRRRPEGGWEAIRSSQIAERVPAGGSIAVTVGSRGLAGIDRIVRATVGTLRRWAVAPFVVAAMGSHGGGTADGQHATCWPSWASPRRRSAARSAPRWTPSSWAPTPSACRSTSTAMPSTPTASCCSTGSSRTPRSPAGIESGLLKMLAIGLGKREGAAQVHKLGLPGLKRLLPEVGALPAQEDAGGPRPGDPRERPRAHRADRGGRARGAARRRAPAAGRGPGADGHGSPSTRSTCWSWASWARTTAGPGSTPT